MAIQNRNTTLPGIWAENAQTTIPTPPVAGVTYRDTTLNSTAIDKAWPFKTIVDSSDFNQHAFLQDTLIKEAEQYGVMRWNNTTTYKEGGYCLGQDKKLYQALRDNQGKEPTASTDDWAIVPTDLSPYQLISNLSQTIDGSTSKYPSNNAVNTALDGKANTSLSNLTDTGKNAIQARIAVNYAAGVTITSGAKASKSGLLAVVSNAGSGFQQGHLTINGTKVVSWTTLDGTKNCFSLLVKAGDVITFASTSSVKIYPFA